MNEQSNPSSGIDPAEAARALDAISSTRHEVAGRVGSPPHYYTKLGAGIAAICLAQPSPTAAQIILILAAVALLAWAIRSYSNATGTWTMATLREPGAWMAWVMITIMLGSLAVASLVQTWAASIPAATLALLATWHLGPKWDAAWVRSLAAADTGKDAA